jgi:hypothetical protein
VIPAFPGARAARNFLLRQLTAAFSFPARLIRPRRAVLLLLLRRRCGTMPAPKESTLYSPDRRQLDPGIQPQPPAEVGGPGAPAHAIGAVSRRIHNFSVNAYIQSMRKTPSPKATARLERQRVAAEDGSKAMQEVLNAAVAVRANMARLRALRLAKEAEAIGTEIAGASQSPRAKQKKPFISAGRGLFCELRRGPAVWEWQVTPPDQGRQQSTSHIRADEGISWIAARSLLNRRPSPCCGTLLLVRAPLHPTV